MAKKKSSSAKNPKRYSNVPRSDDPRVVAARQKNGTYSRMRGLARTTADRPSVSTKSLQARNAAQFGKSYDYVKYGVQNSGQSIRGRMAETVNPKTGNAIAGPKHYAKYRYERAVWGLAAS